ncbi:hypothetical protein DSO57_1013676 [Entomophthora muscae]|uniref:Uncharacterized protein n=1 Tax=Entomophthora muscae TaxID=34485 RepID=A0ACC2SUK8_9FUNG|nr:hypothetical protein DSO57_1013676 [Entomophthora muscae]
MLKYFCLLLSAAGNIFPQTCSTIVTRQEIRSLSPCQLTKYFNAVKQLKNKSSFYLQSCLIHYDNAPYAHGVPAFFPWHRKFLRNFEMALQAIDPSIVLPYWDWTIDSQAPENSPVLSNHYFGGNGRAYDNCVVRGTFAGWNSTIPEPRCLKRQYNCGNKISAFYSPEAVEVLLSQAITYDQLHSSIEPGPHSAVHDGIGGSNGDMEYMYSPNDPIFYSHHAFVDLLWNEWQMRNPSLANTYTGESAENMIPFNVPVSSVFDTTAPGSCYTYPRWNAALPVDNPPLPSRIILTQSHLKYHSRNPHKRTPFISPSQSLE